MTVEAVVKPRSSAPHPYTFEGQYINGVWRRGRRGNVIKDKDPFTGEVICEVIGADVTDVDEAYQTAAKAQVKWAAMLPRDRANVFRRAAAIMEERKEEIVSWLIRESGSTRIKAGLEWELVHSVMEENVSYPYRVEGKIMPSDGEGAESRCYRQPIGVIGVISPWNFPLMLSNRSVAPALAVGNAVVLKPAEKTMITGGMLLGKIYQEAGLPPGVLNVIVGSSREIGDSFVLNPIPGFISFTGSTAVGKHIGALCSTGPMIKGVALELGGSSPLVVLDDADLDQAAGAAVLGRFLHQGQICMSTNRVIVDAKVYDEFLKRFVPRVKALKCGNPNEPDTVIGPIINQEQLNGLLGQVKVAREDGARELLGGEPRGLVLPPHIFADVTTDMKIAQQEVFGPLVTVFKVNGDEEALRVANATEYGLSSSVFTANEGRGLRFALGVEAGMTHINDITVSDYPNNPFGGEKNSGIGRFNGDWVIEEFTRDHWITVQHTPKQYPF
jgi:aldehyde dehydrogenase (NAD+)